MARGWIKKVFGKFQSPRSSSRERAPVPFSHHDSVEPRRHTLTPSPSSTTLANSSVSAESPFFHRLPRELQLQIIILSFGDSIIHLELTRTEPRRLLGYYCQRNAVRSERKHCTDIVDDPCLWQRNKQRSDYDNEKDPRNATVGALGWLMACREAYTLGIDVLYSTNTFFLEGSKLILHLDNLLLLQRIRAMTKIEMIWQPDGYVSFDIPLDYQAYLEMPSKILPNARDLSITFNTEVLPPGTIDPLKPEPVSSVVEWFLSLLDKMVGGLSPTTKKVDIGIPLAMFLDTIGRANKAGAVFEEGTACNTFRLWRPLPPAQWGDGKSALGYWLHESGYLYPSMNIGCFGGGLF